MSSEKILQEIKSLPLEEQRFITNNLLDHLFLEGDDEDDDFLSLDIF